MSTPPPLIALCARTLTFSDEGKRDAFSSSQPYSRAVARAGGVPVLVPVPVQVQVPVVHFGSRWQPGAAWGAPLSSVSLGGALS
jgi:hypothetical protein